MIELRGVSAGYGKTAILHDISLHAKKGAVTTILGRNGSGKSTLLKTIVGAGELISGDILVGGRSVKQMSPRLLAQNLAYLPQGKNVPDILAGRLVLHGRFPYLGYPRKYRREDREIAQRAMEQMGIEHLADRPLAELSGGLRQKVYIAMALAQSSPVIVMDEPTTYLDIEQQLKFAQLVKELAAGGKTVLLVLHDLALAMRISDWVAVMDSGRICAQGEPQTLLKDDICTAFFGVRLGTVMTAAGVQYYYEME